MRLIRRRLMMGGKSGDGIALPPEYQRVAWIGRPDESLSSYFGYDIGKRLYPGVAFYLEFSLLSTNFSRIFFLRQGNTIEAVISGNTLQKRYLYGGGLTAQAINTPLELEKWYKLMITPTGFRKALFELKEGETVISSGSASGDSDPNTSAVLRILGFNGRIKRLRSFSYSTGVDYVDLIPCYRKADNLVGVYDTVQQIFSTNENYTFTKGADV